MKRSCFSQPSQHWISIVSADGDSANSMKENRRKGQKIKLSPPSPELQSDEKSQWMEWGVRVPRQVSDEEKQQLQELLSLDTIHVSFEAVDAANLTLIV